MDDRYLNLQELAAYAGLSVRTLHRYLVTHDAPLPHFRIGDRILVRRSDYDAWAERVGRPHLDAQRVSDDKVRDAVAGYFGRRR